MWEHDRGSRVEESAFYRGLCGAITPDLYDVIPPLTEKRHHRRHIGPHQLKVLTATDRFRLRLIRNGMERKF